MWLPMKFCKNMVIPAWKGWIRITRDFIPKPHERKNRDFKKLFWTVSSIGFVGWSKKRRRAWWRPFGSAYGEFLCKSVESSQVDLNKEQRNIGSISYHFNPKDLVCGIKDYKNENLICSIYRSNIGFVVEKRCRYSTRVWAARFGGMELPIGYQFLSYLITLTYIKR
jgi:hypothetical protein